MMKTTFKFNKLSCFFTAVILSTIAANAQCPDDITVTNDDGECGAVVEYTIDGTGSAQSVNGIVNGNASNGLTGWTATNGSGTTWVASGGAFISSYSMGTMSQVVDLTTMGLSDEYMDTMPAITVSEDYKGTSNNVNDIYKLTVQLRGEANNILATYTTGNITCTANWQTATHVFTGYPAGVRKIYFEHAGVDAEFWAGNFGSAITNASVTVAIPTSTAVQIAGIASGEMFPVGTTTNTFEITDENDVTTTCSFDVTVTDGDAPVAIAQETIIVELDEDGNGTLAAADVNDGSTDNCTNLTFAVDVSSFTCEDLGENTVNFSVSDGTNTTTIPVIVNVVDVIDPVVSTQDITIALDENGEGSITADMVDDGSEDNCSVSLALSKSTFDCSNVGENTINLIATDADGNVATGTATVTVEDTTAPIVTTQNITIQLPAVTIVSISAMDINDGSTDNCGISSYSINNQVFTCENIGQNTVTLTVTDNYGNVSTATAIVTVEDPNNFCAITGLDVSLADAIALYPNPVAEILNIDMANYKIDVVEIYDNNARLVKNFNIKDSTSILKADLSDLASGLYYVKLVSANGIAFKKINKQ
jgi:hypothetical protein